MHSQKRNVYKCEEFSYGIKEGEIMVVTKKSNSGNSKVSSSTGFDKHKMWSIIGVVFALLVVGLLVGYPYFSGKKLATAGKAIAVGAGCASDSDNGENFFVTGIVKDSAGELEEDRCTNDVLFEKSCVDSKLGVTQKKCTDFGGNSCVGGACVFKSPLNVVLDQGKSVDFYVQGKKFTMKYTPTSDPKDVIDFSIENTKKIVNVLDASGAEATNTIYNLMIKNMEMHIITGDGVDKVDLTLTYLGFDGSGVPSVSIAVKENCVNKVDDNGDGKMDCEEMDCSGVGTCPVLLTKCGTPDGGWVDGKKYVLVNDVDSSLQNDGNCFAPNFGISLDCNTHKIVSTSNPKKGYGITILGGTVSNCVIEGFNEGIDVPFTAETVTLVSNTLQNNYKGLRHDGSKDVVLKDNLIINNNNYGFMTYGLNYVLNGNIICNNYLDFYPHVKTENTIKLSGTGNKIDTYDWNNGGGAIVLPIKDVLFNGWPAKGDISSCPETNCADGVDNDKNGKIDCVDDTCKTDKACAPIELTGCQKESLKEGKTYVLMNDISVDAKNEIFAGSVNGDACFTLGEDGITLSCAKNVITGAGQYKGIVLGGKNLQVSRCGLKNFQMGFAVKDENAVLVNVQLSSNVLMNNILGIYLPGSHNGVSLKGNTISKSTTGVYLNKANTNFKFEKNTVCGNTEHDFYGSYFGVQVLDVGVSGVDNTLQVIKYDGVTPTWPVLNTDYKLCAEKNCGDGVDDDGDGKSGCDDTDCALNPKCTCSYIGQKVATGDGKTSDGTVLKYVTDVGCVAEGCQPVVSGLLSSIKNNPAACGANDGCAADEKCVTIKANKLCLKSSLFTDYSKCNGIDGYCLFATQVSGGCKDNEGACTEQSGCAAGYACTGVDNSGKYGSDFKTCVKKQECGVESAWNCKTQAVCAALKDGEVTVGIWSEGVAGVGGLCSVCKEGSINGCNNEILCTGAKGVWNKPAEGGQGWCGECSVKNLGGCNTAELCAGKGGWDVGAKTCVTLPVGCTSTDITKCSTLISCNLYGGTFNNGVCAVVAKVANEGACVANIDCVSGNCVGALCKTALKVKDKCVAVDNNCPIGTSCIVSGIANDNNLYCLGGINYDCANSAVCAGGMSCSDGKCKSVVKLEGDCAGATKVCDTGLECVTTGAVSTCKAVEKVCSKITLSDCTEAVCTQKGGSWSTDKCVLGTATLAGACGDTLFKNCGDKLVCVNSQCIGDVGYTCKAVTDCKSELGCTEGVCAAKVAVLKGDVNCDTKINNVDALLIKKVYNSNGANAITDINFKFMKSDGITPFCLK